MATQDKYDRQLRLWGSEGQRLLGSAHILLLNAGPTGTETLKNLVLPGIGKFTVVDDRRVTESDVANNFFLTAEHIGSSRGETACMSLAELNPDVEGDYISRNAMDFARNAKLDQYSLVVATEIQEQSILELENIVAPLGIPLVIARSQGFIGHARIVANSHSVIESKPFPEPMVDLRLADPFPSLQTMADEIDLATLDDKAFQHVPYCLILIRVAQQWRSAHDGNLPTTMALKKEFRESIKKMARKPWGEEENLLEAYEHGYLGYTVREAPFEVLEILEDVRCTPNPEQNTECSNQFEADFWTMAQGLKMFLREEGNGKLPVSGKVPDLTSSTESYIALQNVYKEKAHEDALAVFDHVKTALEKSNRPSDSIPFSMVETFCKNSFDIRHVRFSMVRDEVDSSKLNKEEIEMAVMEGVGDASVQCPILWYFMLRASDKFFELHGRYPGANGKLELDNNADAVELLAIVTGIISKLELDAELAISMDHCVEFQRYAGTELHNVAAVIGGVVSQEAVKIITHQYVPMDNTYIFNGITCTGAVYKL